MGSRRKQKIQSRTELEESSPVPNKILRAKEIVFVENAVDFVGHCSFCLRLLNVYGTNIEGLAAPVLNNSLTDFRDIWQYLQKKYFSSAANSPSYDFVTGMKPNGTPIYSQVPAMCSLCHEEIVKLKTLQETLVDLMKTLDNQVKSIEDIVLGCAEDGKNCWRGMQFKETLMNVDIQDERIDNTLRFLDELRGILKSSPPKMDSTTSTSISSPQQGNTKDIADVPSKNDSEILHQEQFSTCINPEDKDFDRISHSNHGGEEDIKSELDSNSEIKSEIDSEQSDEEMMEVSSAYGESDMEEDERYTNTDKDPLVGSHKKLTTSDDPLTEISRLERLTKKKRRKHPSLKIWHQNCDVCNKRLPCDQMSEHLRSHVQDFVYECPNPPCKFAYITQHRVVKCHLKHYVHVQCRMAATGSRFLEEKQCESCDFTTNSILALRTHLQYHEASSQKNFTCPITGCGEKFTVKQSVEHHLETHVYKPPVKLQKCGNCVKMIALDHMEEHLKTEHSTTEIFPCKQCPFIYSSRPLLIDHLFQHRKEGMVCDICGPDEGKFGRMPPLREHYFHVHKVGTKLVCEHCNCLCYTAESLKVHIKSKHDPESIQKNELLKQRKEDRKLKCDLCLDTVTVEFKSEDLLVNHKIKEHGAEPFSCHICGETFSRRDKFNQHKKFHEGIKIRENVVFTCKDCGMTFSTKQKLKYHWENHHAGETHVCDICAKTFPSKMRLNSHQTQFHRGTVICDVCGDQFCNTKTLQVHHLIHTGERPFSCDICGTRFRQLSSYRTHKKSHEKLGDKFKPRPTFDRKRKGTN